MTMKLLFWGSVLFFYLGLNAPEGNLFYFVAIYLLVSAIGLYCRRRESKMGKPETVNAPPEAGPSS
jgi:hypothetical protein